MLDLIAVIITVIINAALCAADKRPLKRAGYEDKWPSSLLKNPAIASFLIL